ncbi:hypothetical protein RAS1_23430 [Phycisphaerae bacterium RAS1]|nr:hypothetical protein RAS1_23430 [Phycisphaerae bacterium RAS1]
MRSKGTRRYWDKGRAALQKPARPLSLYPFIPFFSVPLCLCGCIFFLLGSPAARAQSNPAGDDDPMGAVDEADAPARPGGMPRLGGERERPFFEPSPEDRAPLKPGEEDQLLAFAEKRFPIMHRLLGEARQRNPRAFARRFENEFAPRLRHLQRIYAENEELGELMRRHAENMFLMQRAGRMLANKQTPPAMRGRLTQEVRQHLQRMVELEPRMLETRARQYADDRSGWTDRRLERVLAGSAPSEEQTPEMSNVIHAYQVDNDTVRREVMRAKLHDLVAAQLDLDIRLMRQRAAQLRQRGDDEIEQRWQRFQQRIGAARGDSDARPKRPGNQPADKPNGNSRRP